MRTFLLIIALSAMVSFVATQAPPSIACTVNSDCATSNLCYTGLCNGTGFCNYTAVVCDDGNFCTTDTCSPSHGCVFTHVDCNDKNPCTIDSCATNNGSCLHQQIPGCDPCPSPGVWCSGVCCPETFVCGGPLNETCVMAPMPKPSIVFGCDGVLNSGRVYDECGICGGTGDSCRDCLGVINGTALIDDCGICNGNNTKCDLQSDSCMVNTTFVEIITCNITNDGLWFNFTAGIGLKDENVMFNDTGSSQEAALTFGCYDSIENFGSCDSRVSGDIATYGWPGIFSENVLQNTLNWTRSNGELYGQNAVLFQSKKLGLGDLLKCKTNQGMPILRKTVTSMTTTYETELFLNLIQPKFEFIPDEEDKIIQKPCGFKVIVKTDGTVSTEVVRKDIGFKVYQKASKWRSMDEIFIVFYTAVNMFNQKTPGQLTTHLVFKNISDDNDNISWKVQMMQYGCDPQSPSAGHRCLQKWAIIGKASEALQWFRGSKTVLFKMMVDTPVTTPTGVHVQKVTYAILAANLHLNIHKDVNDFELESDVGADLKVWTQIVKHQDVEDPVKSELWGDRLLMPYNDKMQMIDCANGCLEIVLDLAEKDQGIFTPTILEVRLCLGLDGTTPTLCDVNDPTQLVWFVYKKDHVQPLQNSGGQTYSSDYFEPVIVNTPKNNTLAAGICFLFRKLCADEEKMRVEVDYQAVSLVDHINVALEGSTKPALRTLGYVWKDFKKSTPGPMALPTTSKADADSPSAANPYYAPQPAPYQQPAHYKPHPDKEIKSTYCRRGQHWDNRVRQCLAHTNSYVEDAPHVASSGASLFLMVIVAFLMIAVVWWLFCYRQIHLMGKTYGGYYLHQKSNELNLGDGDDTYGKME